VTPSDPRPLVSVLVAVYNGGSFLAATIDSVLAQTCSDFELIVVDDGSIDDSYAVLHGYRDERLRIIRQKNLGAPAALATGLRIASGAYVAFLDSDDLWENDNLAAQADLLTRRLDIDLTFSWFRVINQAGQEIGLHSTRFRGTADFRSLLTDFVIGATSNVMVRRAAIEKSGGIDPAFPRFYDMDLFLRVALLRPHNVEAIPLDLMLYRRHEGQISRDLDGMQREWQRVLEKMRHLAPQDVAAVERRASSNMNRYFARIAYESAQYDRGLHLLRNGFVTSPVHFLTDSRNWLTATACLCGLLLPARLHHNLERWAGVRTGQNT
jgi:glycosyltransferase involved in cell wall biosynthesis